MIKLLYRPIDSAILIYFRIIAGILMSQELINKLLIGKFDLYVTPHFNFSYMFFEWVKPWPYWGMVLHYSITIFAGYAVAFNYHYRFFSAVLFLGYTGLFLFEQTEYINHQYLYCLISFWMMFLPLNKSKNTQPAWTLYILLFHMSLAYFFAGIAKLNEDWLTGIPMNLYLEARKDYPLGSLYSAKWAPFAFSYGGLLFDLLIVPLMLFRPTRIIGLVLSIIFHISNIMMFGLATFPWFSLLLTTMFFDPSWPRKVPFLRKVMPWNVELAPVYYPNKLFLGALAVYVGVHLALPLRSYLYPGNTSWTEEGHMFSWRMMLRAKHGKVSFYVQNKKNGQVVLVNPLDHMTKRQLDDMKGHPDMILQYAHYLRDTYKVVWNSDVGVFANASVSLNGRPYVSMIQPGTDLAKEERTILPYKWVRPLEPLKLGTASVDE